MPSTAELDTIKIRPMGSGLEFHWAGDHVATFVWRDVAVETIDLFATWYQKYLDGRNDDPVKLIIDMTQPRFAFTPYLRSRVRILIQQTRNRQVHGRVALLLPPRSMVVEMFDLYMHQYPHMTGLIEPRIFYNSDQALFWVEAV